MLLRFVACCYRCRCCRWQWVKSQNYLIEIQLEVAVLFLCVVCFVFYSVIAVFVFAYCFCFNIINLCKEIFVACHLLLLLLTLIRSRFNKFQCTIHTHTQHTQVHTHTHRVERHAYTDLAHAYTHTHTQTHTTMRKKPAFPLFSCCFLGQQLDSRVLKRRRSSRRCRFFF